MDYTNINTLITKVCNEFRIDRNTLVTSNKEDCVDARAIIVSTLHDKGISDSYISQIMGISRQCANKLHNSFRQRTSKWTVRQVLGTISTIL